MRGIYITHQQGNIVTGHYLWKKKGQWKVSFYTGCTLKFVIEAASRVIHDPQIFKTVSNPEPQPCFLYSSEWGDSNV